MKTISRALIAAASLGIATAGAAGSRETADTARRIQAHITYLADDLLEGRQAGSRGYDIAARYVAAQFTQLGLQPAGDAGSWYQNVPMLEAAAVIPAASFVIERGTERQELVVTEDFLPSASTNAADLSVSAPAVFVGFGVHAPTQGYDDLAGLDLNGKIVVLLGGAPPKFAATLRAHHSSTLTKYVEFVRRGAVGVVGFATPPDAKRNPWARAVQSSWRPRMRWVDRDGKPADSFPELVASASMSPEGAAKLFNGAPKSLASVFDAALASQPQGFDLPVKLTIRRQSLISKRQSANVVGLLRGSDPRLREEYLVLSAHLDHLGKGAPVNGDPIYNGAMDNASGVGVMLEVARHLSSSRRNLRRSVLFIAVTAEESGLLGSDYFARQPTVAQSGLVANINMDMPVMLNPIVDVVVYGAEHSTLGPAAMRAARTEGLQLTADPTPEETFFVRSDQYSFVRQGIPALYVDNSGGAQVSDFLQNHYHQPSDDISRPIHYLSLARVALLNANIVTDVANGPKPRWNPGNFFGETFGRR